MALFGITPYTTRAAYPLASGTTNVTRFHGQESYYSRAENCLGGYLSNPLPQENYLPLLVGVSPEYPEAAAAEIHRIFRDITPTEAAAGITLYRGLICQGTGSVPSLSVYIGKAPVVGTLTIGTEALSIDTLITPNKGYCQRIANETSAPAGISFSAPSSGSPLTLSLTSGYFVLWLKLVIAPSSSASMYDGFDLYFNNGSGLWSTRFFHTVQAGIGSATVVGNADGAIVGPRGDTFTVTVADSSGAAMDPPSSIMLCYIAASLNSPQEHHLENQGYRTTGNIVAPCQKISTGVYQLQFRPDEPGHYQLTFDCGGEYQVQRSVEVSPVQ